MLAHQANCPVNVQELSHNDKKCAVTLKNRLSE